MIQFLKRLKSYFFCNDEKDSIKKYLIERNKDLRNYQDEIVIVVDGFICDMNISFYYILLFMLMEKKENKNVRVVVITQKKNHKYKKENRLYKYFFPTQFLSCEAKLPAKLEKNFVSEMNEAMVLINSPESLLNLRIDGIHFGPNIYAGHLRKYLIGTIKGIENNVEKSIKQGIRNLFVAKYCVETYKPNYLFLTHSDYDTFGAFFKVFIKNDILTTISYLTEGNRIGGRKYKKMEDFEKKTRNYTFSFTDQTYSFVSEHKRKEAIVKAKEFFSNRDAGKIDIFNGNYHSTTKKLNNDTIRKKLNLLDDGKKVVLVAAHLLWDDATSSYTSLYNDYEQWLSKSLKIMHNNSHVYWIIKAHPSEHHMGTNRYVREIIRESGMNSSHVIFLDNDSSMNTFSLLDAVDSVVTVRGTIGFEAAIRGKPVFCAGTGPSSGLGFNTEFQTRQEYEIFLSEIQNYLTPLSQEKIEMAYLAAYIYFIYKFPRIDSLIPFSLTSNVLLKAYLDEPLFKCFVDQILKNDEGDLVFCQ